VAPEQGTSAQAAGALVAQRVAVKVHDQLLEMQKTGQMPSGEGSRDHGPACEEQLSPSTVRAAYCLCGCAGDTCDLLIIDRPFDLMATVLHEWSYEAMATDVLGMQNNVFQYEADTQAGEAERRTRAADHAAHSKRQASTFDALAMRLHFRQEGEARARPQRGTGSEVCHCDSAPFLAIAVATADDTAPCHNADSAQVPQFHSTRCLRVAVVSRRRLPCKCHFRTKYAPDALQDDDLWTELRDQHIGAVSLNLSQKVRTEHYVMLSVRVMLIQR